MIYLKMKIACIKFAGLGSGGTEKYLQTLACILKTKYDVDYYYTNNAPRIGTDWKHPENSEERKKVVESYGIRTIPIHVDAYDEYRKNWIGSNIWDVFDPRQYDAVQTARFGFPEFPFTDIIGPKLIDSIHGNMSDHISIVDRSILLCKWQADKWIAAGGDSSKIIIIPSIVYVPDVYSKKLREKFNIPDDAFVYGMHQRNDPGIFSPIPLLAYSHVETNNTYFVMLGGSDIHRQQALELKLKNIVFLDFSSNVDTIHEFLDGIDVYTHGRSDGEVCSASIIEAMYHGIPIVSHPGLNMGHVEQISDCGLIAYSLSDYIDELKRLRDDSNHYYEKHNKTLEKYNNNYYYKTIESKLLTLYSEIL